MVNNGVISLKFNKQVSGKDWPDLFHFEFSNKQLLGQIRQDAIVSRLTLVFKLIFKLTSFLLFEIVNRYMQANGPSHD